MPASRKLRTAHFLMFIGVVPLLFVAAIAAVAIAFPVPGEGAASDGFLMVALFLFSYPTTLVLGGAGVVWSVYLTRRRIDEQMRATVVLQWTVVAGLTLPLLLLGSLARHLYSP